MACEEVSTLRGYHCAHSCALCLKEVLIIGSGAVMGENEVNDLCSLCSCKYLKHDAVSSWYGYYCTYACIELAGWGNMGWVYTGWYFSLLPCI